MKVQIGKHYTGPAFDRPALRQMPKGWVLEEARPKPSLPALTGDRAVAVMMVLAYVFIALNAIWGWV